MSMLGADLNASLKFLARMPVIDCDHITTLQICRDFVDPIERSLIKLRSMKRTFDEHKLVAFEGRPAFSRSATDQADWHCVQQFVGKMDAGEWLKRIAPFNFVSKRFQHLRLALSQNRKRLDYSVVAKLRRIPARVIWQNSRTSRANWPSCAPCSTMTKSLILPSSLPDFGELCGHQLPEKRPDADVREIISFAAYRAAA